MERDLEVGVWGGGGGDGGSERVKVGSGWGELPM